MIWLFALSSVIATSLISLIGVISFRWNTAEIKPYLLILVSFSAGALLGDVFLHLLPETLEGRPFSINISFGILAGILIFFVLEKFIHWHHCHTPQEHQHTHPLAFMNICGDGLHNFIDGMIIGGSYLVSVPVGVATTIAVILHEIPQEISDFGVLLHSGLSKSKALLFNFLSAATAIIGTIIVLLLGLKSGVVQGILTPFAIGGFIYIAGSDLIPELHKETKPLSSLVQFLSFVSGIAIMMALRAIGE